MNNLSVFSLCRWLLPLLSAIGLIYCSLCYLSDGRLQPISQARADSVASEIVAPRSPLEIELHQFIEAYFAALRKAAFSKGEVKQDIEALMAFYAEQIDYYTWGPVDNKVIEQEKKDYFSRWPLVEQGLLGEIDIIDTDNAEEKRVIYLLNFTVKNPQQQQGPTRISGQARHTWLLRKSPESPEGWTIIEEKQRVLSRQRNYKESPEKTQ